MSVASQLTKAYNEAQAFLGVPSDQLLRMPKPGDEASTRALWSRLGVPTDAAGYDFADVKTAAGEAPDPALVDGLRAAFLGANVPKDAASAILRSVQKILDGVADARKADTTAKIETDRAELKRSWGANEDANRFVAKQAAGALKVTEAELDALANVVGGSRVMEMFRQIGVRMGEDKFIQNGNVGNPALMTREAATAKRQELMRDTAWSKRYLEGDTAAVREMTAVLTLIHGDDTQESRGY